MGEYWNDLDVVEWPTDLESPPMSVDSIEEVKSDQDSVMIDTPQIFDFDELTNRVVYKDKLITIYPLKAKSNGIVVYSFYGVPVQGPGKFLP